MTDKEFGNSHKLVVPEGFDLFGGRRHTRKSRMKNSRVVNHKRYDVEGLVEVSSEAEDQEEFLYDNLSSEEVVLVDALFDCDDLTPDESMFGGLTLGEITR